MDRLLPDCPTRSQMSLLILSVTTALHTEELSACLHSIRSQLACTASRVWQVLVALLRLLPSLQVNTALHPLHAGEAELKQIKRGCQQSIAKS